jgi:GDP-D-mannose 3',5'-epimerase
VRGVDLKRPEYTPDHADQLELLNLRGRNKCLLATRGWITSTGWPPTWTGWGHLRQPRHHPPQQRAHQPEHAGVSQPTRPVPLLIQCVGLQVPRAPADRGGCDAAQGGGRLPTNPQHIYRCEKPVRERLCEYYADELGMQTKVVRFHNIYGPYGTYNGGREKAPAALCHKAAKAKLSARSNYAATASRPARSATTTAWRASTG